MKTAFAGLMLATIVVLTGCSDNRATNQLTPELRDQFLAAWVSVTHGDPETEELMCRVAQQEPEGTWRRFDEGSRHVFTEEQFWQFMHEVCP